MKKKNLALGVIGISLLASQFMHSGYNVVDNTLKKVTESNTTTCKVTSGSIDKIGSEVSCGNDEYYVIESNSNTVSLFSKYNIKYDSDIKGYTQDSTDLGYPSKNSKDFDHNGYRNNDSNTYCQNSGGGCNIYTTVDGVFVNGNVSGTVTNPSSLYVEVGYGYENEKKIQFGSNLISVDLITLDQLKKLGCNGTEPSLTCKNSGYDWIYSTSYWTSTPGDDTSRYVYVVIGGDTSNGSKGDVNYFTTPEDGNKWGFRPVITISKDAISSVEKEDTVNKITLKAESATIISKDVEFKTSVVTETNEIFNTIKTYLKNPELAKIYDIDLLENNKKIQPNGNVTLTFEIENMDINKVKAYRINDDNTLTELETKIVDGKLEVITNHFSVYILTEEQISTTVVDTNEDQIENPDTGDQMVYVLPTITLVILSIAFVSFKLKSKKCHR